MRNLNKKQIDFIKDFWECNKSYDDDFDLVVSFSGLDFLESFSEKLLSVDQSPDPTYTIWEKAFNDRSKLSGRAIHTNLTRDEATEKLKDIVASHIDGIESYYIGDYANNKTLTWTIDEN